MKSIIQITNLLILGQAFMRILKMTKLDEECTYGPCEIIYENDEFLCFYKYVKSQLEGENEPSFETFMHALNYKDGKIIKQKTTVQDLDFDPSEYFNWNWEDYE